MKEKYQIEKEIVRGRTFYPRVKSDPLNYIDPKEVEPSQLPTARVSQDETTSFAQGLVSFSAEFSTVRAKFPLEYLNVIQNLSVVNPDVSQMVNNTVLLGNTGHKIVVETNTDASKQIVLDELNSFALTAFSRFGGVDGYVNSIFAQAVRGGAISNEWVVKSDLSGIERAVLVPLQSIRFILDPKVGDYRPYQKVSDITLGKEGLIPLNINTYQYCAFELLDNSPYGIPPVLAALETLMIQREIIKNIKFVSKKMGLLGFVTMLLKAPTQGTGESVETYRARCAKFLEDNAAALKHNYRDGIAVGFMENFEIQHHSLMDSAAGANELFQMVEQQVFSGLKADPAMHGRSYSTTETYAGVIYEKMLSSLTNYQRMVANVLEYGFKLHLALKGIDYESLYIEFDPSKSLSSERDESAYQTKLDNLNNLYYEGIISQEQRAQEAGYDEPDMDGPRTGSSGFPPSTDGTASQDGTQNQTTKLRFRIDRRTGRYKLTPRRRAKGIPTQDDGGPREERCDSSDESCDQVFERLWKENLEEFNGSCGCEIKSDFARPTAGARRLKAYMADYFRAAYPPIKGSRQRGVRDAMKLLDDMDFDTMDSEQFADQVFARLADSFGATLQNSPLESRVRTKISQIYRFYRLVDKEPFDGADFPVKPSFNLVDNNAVKFLRNSDEFYFGKFISDDRTEVQLKKWLSEEFLQSGRSLRDPGELDLFRKRFGDRVAKEDYKVLRVVETSVTRSKNWGNVLTTDQARVRTIGISGPKNDNLICDWCAEMVKKKFKVKPVVQQVKDIISRPPEDLPELNPFLPGLLSPETVKAVDSDQLLAQGISLPPYHPHCRHRFVVEDFENEGG